MKNISVVVLPQGAKQVSDITSAQQGDLVMVCVTVNALGNPVPGNFLGI